VKTVFGWLVGFYPKEFREEMLATFAEGYRERGSSFRFLGAEFAGVILGAARECGPEMVNYTCGALLAFIVHFWFYVWLVPPARAVLVIARFREGI
jgi:hypothetical protein